MQLAANLFAFPWRGQGNNCNSYLLLAGDLPVLIDPGQVRNEIGEPCLERLVQAMAADGLRLEQVGLVLLTHAHPDHFGAADEVRRRSGAPVALHELDQNFLHQAALGSGKPSFEADLLLKEGDLSLGLHASQQVQVIHTPGHSPGSVVYYLPREGFLFSGDLLFAGSVGRTDLPGGNPGQLVQSLSRLQRLPVQALLPGHLGALAGVPQNAQNLAGVLSFLSNQA